MARLCKWPHSSDNRHKTGEFLLSVPRMYATFSAHCRLVCADDWINGKKDAEQWHIKQHPTGSHDKTPVEKNRPLPNTTRLKHGIAQWINGFLQLSSFICKTIIERTFSVRNAIHISKQNAIIDHCFQVFNDIKWKQVGSVCCRILVYLMDATQRYGQEIDGWLNKNIVLYESEPRFLQYVFCLTNIHFPARSI